MAENRTKQIIIRLTPTEHAAIAKAAEQDGRTMSDFGRRAMAEKAKKLLDSIDS